MESLQNPDASPASDMVREAAVLAKEMGCEVLGLGQYTSIVTKNGLALSDPGLAITTGNSLTVAMTLRAILKAARMRGLDPGHTSLAVVGAAGNIGSAYAALAARQFAPLTLVGSPRPGSRERLEAVRVRIIQDIYGALAQEDAALPAGRGLARHLMELPLVRRLLGERAAPEAAFRAMASAGIVDELISVATDLSSIQTAKVIVAVSNSPDKVIRSEMVQEGAILCDVSVPCSTDQEVIETRRDVLFFTGGIVRLPKGERIEAPAFPLPPGHVFACMAETMVMGLSGIRESISCGAVDLAKIGLVETLARHHGFRLAGLRTDFLYPSELASGGGYHAVAQDAAMGRRNGDGNRDLRKG
jgi:predicted amino acid dehydrogenase